MYKLVELDAGYVSLVNTANEEVKYFFNVEKADRSFIDESFTHAFGIERGGSYEYSFELTFDECLDDMGDNHSVSGTMALFLTKEAETLLSNVDADVLNKIYF